MPSSPLTRDIPKAILYYSPTSVWAAAVLLGLEEKGYGSDEVDLKVVNLRSGENFAPAYLRINPNGTVPALVVPLERTLSAGIPVKYRALTDTKSILEFLDKSRSTISRTHTTSVAPAPALAPATYALFDLCNTIVGLVHAVDVNFLSIATTTPEALLTKARSPRARYLRNRQAALQKYILEEDNSAHATVKALWEAHSTEIGIVERVYDAADKPESDISAEAQQERAEFLKKSTEMWNGTKDNLIQLENYMLGPYTLGHQISLADLHVGAWLTRVFFVSGAPSPPSQTTPRVGNVSPSAYVGFTVVDDAIRTHSGDTTFTLGPKLRAFWELLIERESWRKVYAEGLH